jgi:hypothetical protein
LFHTDVVKVDQDVGYVAMVVHDVASVCPQCFVYSFRHMLQVCLFRCCICFIYICCKCFICMLRMLAMVFKCFFASVSDVCFECFICLQIYVASVISGYVSKVDQILYMGCAWEARRGTSGPHGRGPPSGCVKSRHGLGARSAGACRGNESARSTVPSDESISDRTFGR